MLILTTFLKFLFRFKGTVLIYALALIGSFTGDDPASVSESMGVLAVITFFVMTYHLSRYCYD